MGFRENLLKKIHINRLAARVIGSINPTDSAQRIDSEAMQELLAMSSYTRQKERDLDLYILNGGHILLLDNELKIYNSTAEDIGLRKSPTVKEMISIRNAIKILNDKDVVISRKADTVKRIHKDMIGVLDLSFGENDIESMVNDGIDAFNNRYTDGVIEMLTLFAELLEFVKAPKAFRVPHHQIWGKATETKSGQRLFGPAIILGLMHNNLKMTKNAVSCDDKSVIDIFQQVVKGEIDADLTDAAVFHALKHAVLKKPHKQENRS
jgi:hypothetical protein